MRVLRMVRQGAPYACFCFKQGAGETRSSICFMLYYLPTLDKALSLNIREFTGMKISTF